jgi:hypothetical protein
MTPKAYIGLNEEGLWTLYYGDGSEDEKVILAIGRPFEMGTAIREALNEILQWAWENGYEIDAPLYSKMDMSIRDLIEQEIFDEVFGSPEDNESS